MKALAKLINIESGIYIGDLVFKEHGVVLTAIKGINSIVFFAEKYNVPVFLKVVWKKKAMDGQIG